MSIKPEFECKPIEGEPSFTLLARDPQFSVLIDQWVKTREAAIRCGVLPVSEQAKVDNAKVISAAGAYWRQTNNGLWRHPTADVTTTVVGDVTTVQVRSPNGNHLAAEDARQVIEKSRIPSPIANVTASTIRAYPIAGAVLTAIRSAATQQNVRLGALLAFAHIESAFDPLAKAIGGSAAGLYQFTHDTWTEMVADVGVRLGVTPGMIFDPKASSLIMAERLKQYFARLGALGFAKDTGNAYCLHFLGMTGGSRLIKANSDQADMLASGIFPVAASANVDIFNAHPTVGDLYIWLHNHAEGLDTEYTAIYAPAPVVA